MATTPPEAAELAEPRQKTALANAALLLAFPSCFCWLGAPLALAMGIVALVLAKRNPTLYGGESRASSAIVMSGFALAGLLLLGVPYQGIDTIRFRPLFQGPSLVVMEPIAIGDVRSFASAEESYSRINGEFYDTPACLLAPAACLSAPPPEPRYIDESLMPGSIKTGYVFSFHPGPRPTPQEIARANASASSLKAYAFVAVPAEPNSLGRRFCVDSPARVCVTHGQTPAVSEGRCQDCREEIR